MRKPEHYLSRPILSLQTMLRLISDYDSRILPVVPDGQFGANTYASVRSFQEAYGLPVTGEVNHNTWKEIVEVYNKFLPEGTQPSIAPFWFPGQTIQPGEKNTHLYLVQAMLLALSQYYPELQIPTINGILDDTTQRDLKWIQVRAGLPETGNLNTLTWHALSGLYRTVTGDGT